MAKRTKDDLGAALGAVLTPVEPERPRPMATGGARTEPDVTAGGTDSDGGYERTTTGYRRDSGEIVRRLSLFLTERQRQALRRQAVDAGAENVTEYVVGVLGLNDSGS